MCSCRIGSGCTGHSPFVAPNGSALHSCMVARLLLGALLICSNADAPVSLSMGRLGIIAGRSCRSSAVVRPDMGSSGIVGLLHCLVFCLVMLPGVAVACLLSSAMPSDPVFMASLEYSRSAWLPSTQLKLEGFESIAMSRPSRCIHH